MEWVLGVIAVAIALLFRREGIKAGRKSAQQEASGEVLGAKQEVADVKRQARMAGTTDDRVRGIFSRFVAGRKSGGAGE